MPYIKQNQRAKIDPIIGPIRDWVSNDVDEGNLNYIITRIIQAWPGATYADHNLIIGVLECVKQEYYRRVVVPYEQSKTEANGDVY